MGGLGSGPRRPGALSVSGEPGSVSAEALDDGLDDVGWLPVDATPPDAAAADAAASDESEGPGPSGLEAFLDRVQGLLARVVPMIPWALGVILVLVLLARSRAGSAAGARSSS